MAGFCWLVLFCICIVWVPDVLLRGCLWGALVWVGAGSLGIGAGSLGVVGCWVVVWILFRWLGWLPDSDFVDVSECDVWVCVYIGVGSWFEVCGWCYCVAFCVGMVFGYRIWLWFGGFAYSCFGLLDVSLRVLPTCFCGLLSFWLVVVCRLLVGNWLVGLGCLGYVVGLLCIGGLRSLYGSVVG